MRRLCSAREAGGRTAGTSAAMSAAPAAARAYAGLRSLALATVVAFAMHGLRRDRHQARPPVPGKRPEADLARHEHGAGEDQPRHPHHDGRPSGRARAFYYISSVESQKAFLPPKETDRRVVAVYFGQIGSVDRVAQYGLKDGKVFDYVKNETPTHGQGRRHPEGAVPQPGRQAVRARLTPRRRCRGPTLTSLGLPQKQRRRPAGRLPMFAAS